jgi:ankyrin repeat protein
MDYFKQFSIGDFTNLSTFIANTDNINKFGGEYYFSALMYASLDNNLNAVRELIAHGAVVDHQDIYGDTALMIASANNNIDIIRELIANGANINARNNEGRTSLMKSIKRFYNIDTVKCQI